MPQIMRSNKIPLLVLFCLWAVISLVALSFRYPVFDEIHAWNIAANIPWYQLPELIKCEGHFPLWYVVLKGVMILHLPYPQALFGLNWLFMAGAIWLILFRSPFPRILKVSMVFSMPLLLFYPIFARPYSMTFFLLVLVAVFYKDRLQKPRLFASLLLVCSQTHLFGIIGAIGFGAIFAWDMLLAWKRKQVSAVAFRQSMEICLLTAALLLRECVNAQVPAYNVYWGWGGLSYFSLKGWIKISLYTLWIFLLFKSKRAMAYGIIVFSLGSILHLFFYSFAAPWYFPFFACFIMLATWIFYAENKYLQLNLSKPWKQVEKIINNMLLVISSLIFLSICFWDYIFLKDMPTLMLQSDNSITFVKEHLDLLRNKQVFVLHAGKDTVPALQAENIVSYSIRTGLKFYSTQNLQDLYAYPLYELPVNYEAVVSLWNESLSHVLIAPENWQNDLRYIGPSPFAFQFTPLVCEQDFLKLCIFDIQKDPLDFSTSTKK